MLHNYPHYPQAGSTWGHIKMNKKLMRQVGCLLCSFAAKIAGDTENLTSNPAELDKWLDERGGYARGNDMMVWDSAIAFARSKGATYSNFAHYTIGADLSKVEPTLLAKMTASPCIIRVLTPRNTNHFVLLVDYRTGQIIDPGTSQPMPHTLKGRGYTPNRVTILA